MKRIPLVIITLLLWPSNEAFAQFYTVTQDKAQCKGMTNPSVVSASMPSMRQECPLGDSIAVARRQNKAEQADRHPALVSPLRHISVTSPFGLRTDPFTKRKARHGGLDLKACYEPAYAMMYGEVVRIGRDDRSGLYATLRHGDFTVSYCHLSKIAVAKGEHVCPGTMIAVTGNSGRSTGPHLHLTLKKDGKTVNPAILLDLVSQAL